MTKRLECDVLVVGAGVAGLSTAYHLAQGPGRLRVCVVERDDKLGGHSSGRNAGMIRQALSDPALVRLAREGRQALERASTLKSWSKLGLRTAGSLLLDDRPSSPELSRTAKALAAAGVSADRWSRAQVRRLLPSFGDAVVSDALFCGDDALLDIQALMDGFRRELKRLGVPILCSIAITSIQKKGVVFEVSSPRAVFQTQVLVNAAGAWASEVARMAKAADVPLTAYRRHLFETSSLPGVPRRSPFVWHLHRDFYFRPLANGFLVSPCDKTPVSPHERAGKGFKGEAVDPAMARELLQKLSAVSPQFARVKLTRPRSGLRTMTPDGRFVIGNDPKQFGFFWVAGLGGHGVTTCFSVGRLAADLISGRKVDPQLKKAFDPGRFS